MVKSLPGAFSPVSSAPPSPRLPHTTQDIRRSPSPDEGTALLDRAGTSTNRTASPHSHPGTYGATDVPRDPSQENVHGGETLRRRESTLSQLQSRKSSRSPSPHERDAAGKKRAAYPGRDAALDPAVVTDLPRDPPEESPPADDTSRMPPGSNLEELQSTFGNTNMSMAKAGPIAKKAGWALWSALGSTLKFGAKGLVNAGAATYILPPILKATLPIRPETAEAASRFLDNSLQRLMPGDTDDFPVVVQGGATPATQINKVALKTMGKIVKAEKADQLLLPFLKILTDGRLTLPENAQKFADGVAEKTQAFETAHPEFKEQLEQLRNLVKNYKPPEDQTELDREILGILIAPKIMADIPCLPKDPADPKYIPPTGIFKSPRELQLFDDALPDILNKADKLEIENPDDVEIFHARWRNLQLSDDMPFILIGGEGATEGDGAVDLARDWCKKVGETPMEVDADDLVEMLAGSRPKEAMPRLAAEDPSPVKQLGGFYSRVESGNPTSPMIIKGFDSKNPDHAILIPLLENSSEISIPYKGIPDVFRFNTKGMAVFLCEDDASAGRSKKLEVAAGDKAKDKGDAGDKVKDKAKDKTKDKAKAPAEEKTKDKDKAKDKGKEKGPDGERMKNLGVEKLKVVPKATFKSPSEQRRTEKLQAVLDTKVLDRLDLIVPDEDTASTALKDAIKATAGSDEYKKLIVKKSVEHKVPLKETEKLALYVAEQVAAKYRRGVTQTTLAENPQQSQPGSSSAGAENQVTAFIASDAKKTIDKSIGKFIENYFKRFEKEDAGKSEDKDKDAEKKTAASLPPAWLKQVDVEAMLDAFPVPISAQGKQPLPKGQKTLHDFMKPEVLDPLLAAAKRGDVDALVQQLGEIDGELTTTDKNGNTALHLAVQSGKTDAVRALLQHPKVNINAQNGAGSTVLHMAIDKGNKELVELLLEKSEDIDFSLKDKKKRTLIEAAGELMTKQGANATTLGIVSAVMEANPKTVGARFFVLPGGENAKSGK
jgi:hypothetical protein